MVSGGYEAETGRKRFQERRNKREEDAGGAKGKEEQEQPVIRVLLKTGGYTDEVHPNVAVSAGEDFFSKEPEESGKPKRARP